MRDAASTELDSTDNRALARELAERSIILLDAGTALPLLGADRPPLARVAVVGPCAADPRTFLGCYAFPESRAATLCRDRSRHRDPERRRRAVRAELPDVEVVHEPGCSVTGTRSLRFRAPPSTRPRDADLCIALVGDRAGLFGRGTSGEGCDVEDLRLPGVQAELLDALLGDRHAGRRRGRLRPSLCARRRRRSRRRAGPGVHAGRGGRRGDRRRAVRTDPARAASCRCRSRGIPAGNRRTYLQPPLGGVESAGISSLDATPAVPVRLRRVVHHASRSTTCG